MSIVIKEGIIIVKENYHGIFLNTLLMNWCNDAVICTMVLHTLCIEGTPIVDIEKLYNFISVKFSSTA